MEVELVSVGSSPEPSQPETPAVPASPETPQGEPTPESAPTTPEPVAELYELPDGRKVDAETLQREWRDNFMPDYTRKSQELASRSRTPEITTPEVPKWKDPNYVPGSYAEIIELGKEAALAELRANAEAEERSRAQVMQQVDSELATIKAKDSKLDENALFQHANKYGFTSLAAAYANMQDMRKVVQATETRVLKGKVPTPVSNGGTPPSAPTPGIPFNQKDNYGSALEYFRSRNTK